MFSAAWMRSPQDFDISNMNTSFLPLGVRNRAVQYSTPKIQGIFGDNPLLNTTKNSNYLNSYSCLSNIKSLFWWLSSVEYWDSSWASPSSLCGMVFAPPVDWFRDIYFWNPINNLDYSVVTPLFILLFATAESRLCAFNVSTRAKIHMFMEIFTNILSIS